MLQIDALDRKILSLMQSDASLTTADLAEKVGLTTTPCWRRIQRLQDEGFIKKRAVLLNPTKLDLNLTVFVHVKAAQHDSLWLENFAQHASTFDQVVEFYRLSGEYDYMLKVLVKDMRDFDHFYKRFIKGAKLGDVTSSFAMEEIKNTTVIPIR